MSSDSRTRNARRLYSGNIAAATNAARGCSQPVCLVVASQARNTSSCALLREPAAPYDVGELRTYETASGVYTAPHSNAAA